MFFDPNSDVRIILPHAMRSALTFVLDSFEGTEHEQDALYLDQCVRILEIRLEEDSTPMDAQLGEFLEAIGKVPQPIVDLWLGAVTRTMLFVYALFMRRDSATDKGALAAMLESSRLSLFRDSLSAGTLAQMKAELRDSVSLLVANRTREGGTVVCPETGEVMEHVKDIARQFIGATGDRSWNALADACDREFEASPDKKTREQLIALALAYPTYRHPCLEVKDEEDNGLADETGQAAGERGPGAVQVDQREEPDS